MHTLAHKFEIKQRNKKLKKTTTFKIKIKEQHAMYFCMTQHAYYTLVFLQEENKREIVVCLCKRGIC